MQLHQMSPGKTKKSLGTLALATLISLSAYSAWAVSPASVPEATQGQSIDANSTKKTYQVKTKIELDGISISPRIISKQGDAATIQVDGKSAKWTISYTLSPAKAKNGLDLLQMEMTVERADTVIAQPKLLMGFNMPARIQQKREPMNENDFEISLEPSLVE